MHTNQRILVNALITGGYSVKTLDPESELIEVTKGDSKYLVLDRTSSNMSLLAAHLSANKYYTKQALNAAGLSTPEGRIFDISNPQEYQEGITYGLLLKDCVVKPNYGSHADNIHLSVQHKERLSCIFDELLLLGVKSCIVEKYVRNREYRVFITEKGKYACVHRQAARVVGDGLSTVENLIIDENKKRLILKSKEYTSLCPIVVDDETFYCLAEQEKSLLDIPLKDEIVYIRRHSNLAKGGIAIDMTSQISKEFVSIAFQALKSIEGLNVAGVDILCEDPTVPNPNYVILEVNSNPGLAMHAFPAQGNTQPVGEYLIDVLF